MLKSIGAYVRSEIAAFPYVAGYVGRVFSSSFSFVNREKAARKVIIMQLLFTFIEALPIIAILAAALGSALYVIGYSLLLSLGSAGLIYSVLVIVVARELGPLLVAFVVAARSATAIATELGGMVTSHQIESYISVGIDPIDYLVSPRFLGVTLSVFFLNAYFSLSGLLVPAVMAQFINHVPMSEYFRGLFENLSIMIIVTSMIKSLAFGMLISIISTYYGFNVERASTEIPVAGIQAVSKSFVGVICTDVFIIVIPTIV